MDILFWIKFRWLRYRGLTAHLYVLGKTLDVQARKALTFDCFLFPGVIFARIYVDYFLSNFVEYFQDNLHFDNTKSAKILNIRDGLAGILGIVGAVLVDVCLTHYGMTFLSSVFYAVGLSLITYGNADRKREMPEIPGRTELKKKIAPVKYEVNKKNFVLIGFLLSGIGKYSLKNSSNSLAKEKEESNESINNPFVSLMKLVLGCDSKIFVFLDSHRYLILLFFVKYATRIFFVLVTTITNIIAIKYGRNEEKWTQTEFLVPTIGFGLVPIMSLFYVNSFVKPTEECGTPLKGVLRVYVAAFRKRNHSSPQHDVHQLYEENTEHPLKHTNSLRFLDKAAIIELSTQPEEERRKWRLCTVTEVEEAKRLLRMFPMCMTFLAYGMVKSIGNTVFIQQGNDMDSTLGHLNIDLPIQTLLLLADISGSGIKGLYVLLLSRRLTGSGEKYGSPIKYGIGIVLATFCCTVAAYIARDKAESERSVFWLTPQFILFGAMSGVTRDGIEGFFREQLPPSLRRYDSVFTDAMIGAGAVFFTVLIYATRSNIDLKHLHSFYSLLTIVSFVILSVYTFVATSYGYQNNEEAHLNA
ncbi:hypothetical protein IFM89_031465 [Coptis chinensis]|uniref:Uncharacterized protein n=1 Tax=Coptis chinensis TaxID=261450 RepID=A0A835HI72_9MAGN|nr:hypothetical protein IFM89_031465 [Coptis chinensis]